jgi:hypothetical protein
MIPVISKEHPESFPCGGTSLGSSAIISNAPFRVSVYLRDVTASLWVEEKKTNQEYEILNHKCVTFIP